MNTQQIISQFAENLKMEFDINDLSVYRNNDKIYGSSIDRTTIEKYLSLPCTTVYKSSCSTFVTRLAVNNDWFVFVLSSCKADTFDGQEAEYIVSDIKKLIGKLGD